MCPAKPIDLLAKYISSEENVDAIEMHEPYMYLNGLSIQDYEDLVEDIKVRIISASRYQHFGNLRKFGESLFSFSSAYFIVKSIFQVYMELERGKNLDYWNDVTILVEDELRKSKKLKKQAEFEGTFYM